MPDLIVEPCSEYARASGPNAIKAAFKKSKSALQPFYTTGLKNVAEPAYESEFEDEKPVVCKTPIRFSFGNVMAQARGHHDLVSHEKKKGDEAMKDEHERPNAPADTPRSGVSGSLSGLVEFSRPQKALQDNDQYRPRDPYISRKPLGVKDSNELPALLSMKKRNHQSNQSEVKMCNHKTFVIYWDPEDPSNRNGSFIARVADHKEKSHMTVHPCCDSRSVNVKEMAVEMASNIIKEFEKQEDDRVTSRDRRRKGIEPGRSPLHSVVLREVHNMYSQLYRDEIRKLVKTGDALHVKLDAGERRKQLAEQTQLAAQRSRQRGGTVKDRNNHKPEGGDKPDLTLDSSPSKRKKKKTPKQIAEERVARNKERRGLIDIARVRVEPLDRYKPSTVEEQQARAAQVADQIRRERSAKAQNTALATKPSRESKKFAVAIDAAKDDETISSTQEAKKAMRRHPARRVSDSDDESSENEVGKTRKVGTNTKSQRMSKADRALLAGIAQAGQEESEKYTQAEAEAASELELALSNEEKQVAFLAEIAAIERAQLAAQEKRKSIEAEGIVTPKTTEKRKASPQSDDVGQFPREKSRKSTTTIKDSDEEADFALPEVSPALSRTKVRQEFTTEADQLVEEVQKQQEEKGERCEAAVDKAEEIVVNESIKVAEEKGDGDAEAAGVKAVQAEHTATFRDKSEQAPTSPAILASQGSKRKNSFPNSGEEHQASPSSPSLRRVKKAKQNGFSKEVVPTLEQDRKIDVLPAAAEEVVQDSVVTEEISSDDTEGEAMEMSGEDDGGSPITEQTGEGGGDGLDYLFEE